MSYDMAFKGTLHYPNKRLAKKALKRFRKYECLEDSVVQDGDLVHEATFIRVECFTSAPASMWDSSCGAVELLADLAIGGHVNAQYDGGEGEDSILRLRYLPGGEERQLEGPFPDGMEPSVGGCDGHDDDDDDGDDAGIGLAAMTGDENKVRKLLSKGVHPRHAVHGAVHHPALIRLLLEHGLDPKGDARRQYSPLCAAARGRSTDTVRMLVAAGAGTEETDTGSMATPLMLAAENLSEDVVAVLLELGADPCATDAEGNTAAMYAVQCANDEAVRIALALEEAGASREAKNNAGRTVLDIAEECLAPEQFSALVRG